MVNTRFNGDLYVNVEMPRKGIFHIRASQSQTFKQSLLTKYEILDSSDYPENYDVIENGNTIIVNDGNYTALVDKKSDIVVFGGSKRDISVKMEVRDESFSLEIPITEDERLFGLGDESRKSVMKRGRTATMWQANVTTYGPIPFMVSSNGWGILVNCTYKHTFDLGETEKDKIKIAAKAGNLDFYIFLADSMKEIIGLYTDVSGKPVMLPKAAYGLTFVNNEEEGARDLLQNCLSFRREDIPCDIMGLEPGWMETHYDYSLQKKWDPEKFYLPYWQPENYGGEWSFFYNMRQMGYLLSVWLCCDYDLFWYEEGNANETEGETKQELRDSAGATILDDHFVGGTIIMDKITVPSEPWFEHLKKFVDQGVSAFKLDAAMQVMEHPDRLWAGKYRDDEIHNLYPVVYAKQMQKGFSEYTGRRALIYTPSMYAGTQQYAATWAGDTGGGNGIVPYIMNMAFCGHTNASCDMAITYPEGIHFGFLMPWTQLLGWRNWFHPWFLGDELEGIVRDYAKLRSSLFPYIYSMAHIAAKTGLALARPLPLMYEDTAEFDDVKNMYMLGDSLLVGAFDMHLKLPQGNWLDWFTGKIYEGNCQLDYEIPKGKGGALFIKEGSVFITQEPKRYLTEPVESVYTINIFGKKACSFDLIEDDGMTYAYKDGAYGQTHISVTENGENSILLTVKERVVPGGQEIELPEITDFKVKILGGNLPTEVNVGGNEKEIIYDEADKTVIFIITKEERNCGDVICEIKY